MITLLSAGRILSHTDDALRPINYTKEMTRVKNYCFCK
jgi:hypothetical protein